MIRIGVIGLGWWGKQIVTCLSHSPRFKVVAGCDIDTAMAQPFAARRHVHLACRQAATRQRAHGFTDLPGTGRGLCRRRDRLRRRRARANHLPVDAALPWTLHPVWRQGWVEVQEGGNVDKGIPSSFVHCDADGTRTARSYDHTNTVRLNFEAWANAIEGRARYRFSADQLLANIRILDAVTRSAAAEGRSITL